MSRRILVFGGSGQVGRFLLPRLATAGFDVTAVSRHAQPVQAGVSWQPGEFASVRAGSQWDAVVSLGPLDAFAHWYAAEPSVPARVVAMSSMSAEFRRDSADPAERAVAQRLLDAERVLLDRAASACLLRGTLHYGAARDKSLTPLARWARRTRLFPRLAAAGLRQPVHADDLALACVAALQREGSASQVLPLGGAERLSFGLLLERVRASLGFATVPLPLPRGPLEWILPRRYRGSLARLERDLVADNTAVQAALGVTPRPFSPTPACWFGAALPPRAG